WWWRSGEYEITDGYIHPVAGSVIERYEPWRDYNEPEGKQAIAQPYNALFSVIRRIRAGTLSEADRDKAIKAWCRGHGLLGVLLHQSESATFTHGTRGPRGTRAVTYVREFSGWTEYGHLTPEPTTAIVRDLVRFQPRFEPDAPTWYAFFPGR